MMEIFVFILIVIGCVVCKKWSDFYNEQIENKYGAGCINWLWSIILAVLLTATFLTIGESAFWLFLLFTLGGAVLSVWLCYQKLLSWGATSEEAKLGGAAQAASVVGIAALLLFIILLVFGGTSKKRRRR